MTSGQMWSAILNAVVFGLSAAFVILQSVDWVHVVPTAALWTTVAITGVNAALHYLTGTSK